MILKFVLFYFVIISVTPEHNIKLALAQSVLNRFVNTLISTPIQPISSFKPILDFLNPFSSEPISAYTKQGQGISNYRPGQSHQSLTDRAPEANDQLRSNSQPSVCTGYWFYQHDKNNGNSGLLKIPNPSRTQNDVRITLSLPFRLHLSDFGEISLLKSNEASANDIANNQPLLYKIRFPVQNPLPKPTAIYLNDKLLCSGPQDTGQYTILNLHYTFFTKFSGGNQPQRTFKEFNQQFKTTQAQYLTRPQATTSRAPVALLRIATPSTPDFRVAENIYCGISSGFPVATGLVTAGQTANRAQFPWLAAYYHSQNGFICGGSLVSSNVIVTAAHCIQNKLEPIIRKEDSTFYLGKYQFESLSEPNIVVAGVTQLIIHPSWDSNDERFDADIAIAVLLNKIPFSKFIRPICLWRSTRTFVDIVGKSGVIAGWGLDEKKSLSTMSPKWASLPVVDTLTCIRSNSLFNRLTSERTFCAGKTRDGRGPCNGDSGGAFIMNSGNRWYLRGIISSALYDSVQMSCDAGNFAIFTDVAQFTGWIDSHIQNND